MVPWDAQRGLTHWADVGNRFFSKSEGYGSVVFKICSS